MGLQCARIFSRLLRPMRCFLEGPSTNRTLRLCAPTPRPQITLYEKPSTNQTVELHRGNPQINVALCINQYADMINVVMTNVTNQIRVASIYSAIAGFNDELNRPI